MRPTVTVALPVRNGGAGIAAAAGSILGQTLGDLELIVTDNASTDATQDICRDLAATDPRVRYVRLPRDIGAARNFELGRSLARGRYVKWAAHDDRCEPLFLERCVEALSCSADAVGAFPLVVDTDLAGTVTGKWPSRPRLTSPDPAVRFADAVDVLQEETLPIFGVFRASVLAAVGPMGAYPSADRVLLAALALQGPLVEVAAPLFLHGEHAERSVRAVGASHGSRSWWTTQASSGPAFPYWRQLGELLRTVRAAPVPARTRRACLAVLPGWVAGNRHWAKLGYDAAVPLRPWLDRRYAAWSGGVGGSRRG